MDSEDLLYELLPLLNRFGVDPRVPRACHEFFLVKIQEFEGSDAECIEHIVKMTPSWFRCLNTGPEWIQNPKWMFSEGKPMVFVGQIDVKSSEGWPESAFFLFWNPDNGDTEVVHQSD